MHTLLLALLFFADPQSVHPGWCEASRQTSHELKKLYDENSGKAESTASRLKRLDKLTRTSPLDLDLHLAYQLEAGRKSQPEREQMIERYRQLAVDHHDVVKWQYLYAAALVDSNTPQAIAAAKSLVNSAPAFPRTHLLLAGVYYWGKFKNKALSEKEIEAYFEQCPGSLHREAVNYASQIRDPLALQKVAMSRAHD